MGINFNPFLPHNDSLTPAQIEAKANELNAQTRDLVEKAYKAGGVPPSSAENAAEHSSVSRRTSEAQKARNDAKHWYWGKAHEVKEENLEDFD